MEDVTVSRRLAIELLVSLGVMSAIGLKYVLAKDATPTVQSAILQPLPEGSSILAQDLAVVLDPATQTTRRPEEVLGLHLPISYLRDPNRLAKFQERIFSTGANCAVVEIKNESGAVIVPFEHELKSPVLDGQETNTLIELIGWLTGNNIYPVARQVVMMDTTLANHVKRLALHFPNRRQTDASGHVWLDPRHAEIADYNATIAQAAAQIGFAEVQLDYIRYPEANFDRPFSERVSPIANAIGTIKAGLPQSALLTIDLLGDSTRDYPENISDVGLGQHIPTLAQLVDGICPMLYPDLRGAGFEVDFYQYVFDSTQRAVEKVAQGGAAAFVSPWIQAYYPANKEKIQQQAQAAFDAGANGVFAWEPTSFYPNDMYRPGV